MARLSPEEGLGALEDRLGAQEVWRISHPAYEVSNLGRVRRSLAGPGAKVGRVLRTNRLKSGYLYVSLCYQGLAKSIMVHRLVARAFLGLCPDGDKTNNCLDNLEYVTPDQNVVHACVTGLVKRGEEHGKAKLSEFEVVLIKERLRSGVATTTLAREYGVARAAISKIKHGRNWAHVN